MNTAQPELMQAVLRVKRKTYLSPHYIRMVLEGDDLSIYQNARIGDNNKIVIPKDKTQALVLTNQPMRSKGATNFYIRTYTLRALDIAHNEMTIDFVMHGETGPASSWAIHAEKGDELGVLMKTKKKPLFKTAANYILMGDHTALPVISAILETLPATAKGTAMIEVHSQEDVIDLQKPKNMAITWVFNANPGTTSQLPHLFDTMEIPQTTDTFVFAAAEYSAIKTIQQRLRNTPGLSRENWYAFSYWKHGIAEDQSASERRDLRQG